MEELTTPTNSPLAFVYGTLQQAYGNHRVMREAKGRFIGIAHTETKYPMYCGGIPYLVNEPHQGHHVRGELYEVQGSWTPLDRLEGTPTFYYRAVRNVVVYWNDEISRKERARFMGYHGDTFPLSVYHDRAVVPANLYFINRPASSFSGQTPHASYEEYNHTRYYG